MQAGMGSGCVASPTRTAEPPAIPAGASTGGPDGQAVSPPTVLSLGSPRERWRFLDPDPSVISAPHRINGSGQVVGEAGQVSETRGVPTNVRPTLWDHDGGHDLADAASCDPAA